MSIQRHDPFPVDPTYAGIYAHGVELPAAARTLIVSGQIGVAPDGSLARDFEGQFVQAIENAGAVLAAADMRYQDVVKMSVFLLRHDDIPRAADIRKRYFAGVRPAITTVLVAGLVSPDWLVEVELLAAQTS